MGNVLITTLGRAKPLDSGKTGVGRYQTVKYRFENGCTSEPTAFFGVALKDYLQTIGIRVDRIAILGTRSSMWDAWLEVEDELYFENEAFASELADAATSEAGVTDAQFQRLAAILAAQQKTDVVCKAIPYGMTEDEQLAIVQTISDCAFTWTSRMDCDIYPCLNFKVRF